MEITLEDIRKTVKEALAEENTAGIQPKIYPPLADGYGIESAISTTDTIDTNNLINQYLVYKADGGAADGYLKVRERKLRFFARQYPQLPDDPDVLRTYLRQFKTAEVPTRQDQWKALFDLHKFAAKKYKINNPLLEVAKPHYKKKPGDRLSRDEAKRALSAIRNDFEWALFTVYFGLRFRGQEAERLLSGDIKEDYITVRGKVRTDELPLVPVFRDKLLALQNGQHTNDPHFPIKADTMAYHIEKVLRRADIKGNRLGPQILRNTAGALWSTFGGDWTSNRQLLRHSAKTMTDHYSPLTIDELRTKDELHNPMLNLMRELGLAPPYPNTSSAQQP